MLERKTALQSIFLEKIGLIFTIRCAIGSHELDCDERSGVHYYSNIHIESCLGCYTHKYESVSFLLK